MMLLQASILIPTYNRRDSLKRLFDSIRKQTFLSFEVIVIDGGSNDATAELCRGFSGFFKLKLIRQDKKGFVNAVNCGIKEAEGDIIVRIDDDVVLTEGWLENLMLVFQEFQDAGCVSGPVITPEEELANRDVFVYQKKFINGNYLWQLLGKFYFGFILEGKPFAIGRDFRSGAFSFGANFPECLKLKDIIEVDHPESCNMAFRKDLSLEVGNFDESFSGTAEYCDSDLAYKIRAKGYRTFFNPKALLYHYPTQKGFYAMRLDSYHRMINFLRFYRRHIKKGSLDKLLRFSVYLVFLNAYFFYNFLKSKDPKQLKSFPATVIGLLRPLRVL